MEKVSFAPPHSGAMIENITTELVDFLDHLFLSVVKLELDTGKAWLLHSVGRSEQTAYEFDWETYVSFYQVLLVPDEAKKLPKILSVETLYRMWQAEQTQHRMSFSCQADVGMDSLEVLIRFITKEEAPIAYIVARQSGDNYLLRRIIDLYVYNNCDCFIYLDAKNNSYTMFNGKKNTPLPEKESDDYEAEIVKFSEAYVVPEDREMVLREMSIKRITEVLATEDVHSFTCGFWKNGVGYTRKRFEYRYYNRGKQMVLLSRSDITKVYEEQRRYTQDLQDAIYLAQTDPLTQLLNYRGIQDAVSASLGCFNNMAAILFMDLDDFKKINDTYGHATGDKALRQVAEVIKGSIRAHDYASRIGGDEFVIFLSDLPDAESAVKCAQRICNKMAQSDFVFGDIHLSCSIGVAIAPDEGTEYKVLVKKADQKVYEAKARGKNQVAI